MTNDADDLALALAQRLKAIGGVLATVESCTGGLVAHRITNVPGSSDVFWGAWVTYDNSAKQAVGVPAELIMAHGAVSEQVARSMCESGLTRLTTSLPDRQPAFCLATTGIAGPGGATETKPVGLSYVGLAATTGETVVVRVLAPKENDRLQNKQHFADRALELLRGALGASIQQGPTGSL